ncbi:hypothetical protein BAE46_13880 [Glaciecola punicea]|nr:hypothetical protein BAE46_13880 [Glaciecola punicea]
MQKLKSDQVAVVSGGMFGNVLIGVALGYVGKRIISSGSSSFRNHINSFSLRNHSGSNSFFLINRHHFNSTI